MSFSTAEVVRNSVLEQLRALSDQEIARRSAVVISRLIKSVQENPSGQEPIWHGKTIGLFRSLKREIQLSSLESEFRKIGARLCFPRITDSSASLMRFVQVDDPSHPESWEPGPYGGGLEPRVGFPEVAPEALDVIIVPGLAFGQSGERIGRGKGYYDRFLNLNQRAVRIAPCFDFQFFPSLKQNPWDQRVHWIVSESRHVKVKL